MNQSTPRPPILEILPESAPFTAEQRTWLNGFFAGLLQLDAPATPLSPQEAAALLPGLLAPGVTPAGAGESDDGAPWHDPAPWTESAGTPPGGKSESDHALAQRP